MYIHELKDWPHFVWDERKIALLLAKVHHLQELLIEKMRLIDLDIRVEWILKILSQDVIKSSEIEGQILDPAKVKLYVARYLEIGKEEHAGRDRHLKSIVAMMLDATQELAQPVTKERLFQWHAALFPNGWNETQRITVGQWRKGTVEIVSGQPGDETIYFKAPSAEKVDQEMTAFVNWLNQDTQMDLILKAAIAHLWFVTIHPFDDGNGRIGRAITDYLLAHSEKSSDRFYSLSAQIRNERKGYYLILQQTQKNGMNITSWIEWFLYCLASAIEKSLSQIEATQQKERAWKAYARFPINERQRKVIDRLLDGFEGHLNATKWVKLTKSSHDTALRDIVQLVEYGILINSSIDGRGSNYILKNPLEIKQVNEGTFAAKSGLRN